MAASFENLTPGAPGFDAAVGQVAELRIRIFREWPYLYDGTEDWERRYISKLAEAEGAVVIAARDGARIIGVSTGMPLLSEHDELIAPFRGSAFPPEQVFYGAETVMLPEYRGQGLYRGFLDRRREHAIRLGGFRWETFCGVVRPADHPLRDPAIPPLDPVWQHFGFRKVEGLTTGFSWKDIDEESESEKPMQFWVRDLA
ncbi:GNAT family N-acetyltransferase [Nisaea acidiphila]|uniref:GNAT family N-acetyltransferase n=1 Tax=Nisaea acidiphila TaxID=1862145 RepID=A0A9J7APL8_9PROT|nr:GNAT family N-acetyltransferase [Nisaea acidiphila]UUX49102.1 GNAT family N-acetyltransferase [Nisaea acidiphila]